MVGRGHRLADAAVSDVVSTILLVALVVLLGGGVAIAVTATLDAPVASSASVSLATPEPGDTQALLLLRNGAPVPLEQLRILLARGDSAPVEAPRGQWTTPDPAAWRAGDSLAVAFSPALLTNETIRVSLYRIDANALVAQLAARAGGTTTDLGTPTLTATATPATIPADGVTATRLAVRVSHPLGALAVAGMRADLSNITAVARSASLSVELADDGLDGDAVGGDGVWSALVALPSATVPGTYSIGFVATDANGVETAATSVQLGATDAGLRGAGVNGTGTVLEGEKAFVGTSFAAPPANNFTFLTLRNWTTDQLHPTRLDADFVNIRIVDGTGASWSCSIKLEEQAGQPYATQLKVWSQTKETVYTPRNGTRLPLAGLSMDLLHPIESLQWVRASGDAHPEALYPSSGIGNGAQLIMPVFGDDVPTGNTGASESTGILSVEVVFY